MEKLKMHTPDMTSANIARIRELFPSCVTESRDDNGQVKLAVNFDQLRQELSDSIVEGPQERYHLNWPGKREALLTANAPIAKTLRPAREESVDFDTTKNLFIEGDNLDALKLLRETYLGKVKMIYIDPPYNTGGDFVYDDDFSENADEFLKRSNQKDEQGNRLIANTESNGRFHSDWLTMIYPRLKLARNLLSDNGVIFISIDDNEYENLKKICDEVFGEDNFIETLVWKRRATPPNDRVIGRNHEYILAYSKSIDCLEIYLQPRNAKALDAYINPDNDPRGVYRVSDLSGSNKGGRAAESCVFEIFDQQGKPHLPPKNKRWLYNKEKMLEYQSEGRIGFRDGSGTPFLKRYLTEVRDGITLATILYDIATSQDSAKEIRELFNEDVIDFPKPIELIKTLLTCGISNSDTVLDFFAGSASTAHAVFSLNAKDGGNRKFIMVQLPEVCDPKSEAAKAGFDTIAEISKERIRRAGKMILEGECNDNWNKDVGFRVLKIDTSNMAEVYYTPDGVKQDDLLAAVDNIKPDRKPEDLLFQVLLDWGVDLSLPITRQTIQGKTVFFVDGNALVACFDNGITEELVKELAAGNPLRVVFRDNGFVSDSVKINAGQIFKQMSPGADVKSI